MFSKNNQFSKNGFVINKNFFSQSQVRLINKLVDNLPAKTKIPYSENIPWGYGNLIDNNDINKIINLEKIKKHISVFMSSGNIQCNLLLIANKPAFIGPDVEWHQEFLNINTFAPGYSPENDLDKFIQIFIALDEHRTDNGPLLIYEKSHQEGLLPCEDIINSHLNHKRRIKFEYLNKLNLKYKLRKVLLKPGSALIFNHLLVHGSANNCSPFRRRAMVIQFRIDKNKNNKSLYEQETKIRKSFIISECNKRIKEMNSKKVYKDVQGTNKN